MQLGQRARRELQVGIEMLENEQYEGVGVPHVILYQCGIVVEQLRVCKRGFGYTQEIIFWHLAGSQKLGLLRGERGTHVIELMPV